MKLPQATTLAATLLALACDAAGPPLLEMRLASAEPVDGWEAMEVAGDTVWVADASFISDEDVAAASPVVGNGRVIVTLEFGLAGSARLRETTRAHLGRPIAVLFDGEVISAPVVMSEIGGGQMAIPAASPEEAEAIADRVRARWPSPRPEVPELHQLVLDALGEELRIDGPVLVHPLLIRREAPDRPVDPRTATFNAHDSSSVRLLAMMDRRRLELCRTTPSGTCVVGPGQVAVTLSEPWDVGEDAVGVAVVVRDGRGEEATQRYYALRIAEGRRGWEVVDARPIS